MNIRKVITILAVLLCVGMLPIGILLARRPAVRDFCVGPRRCEVLRLTLEGQGKHATLLDVDSLRFLAGSPRLRALPANQRGDVSWSYNAKIFDRWGCLGSVPISVDSKSMHLTYLGEMLHSEESYSYIEIGTNAPPKLKELIAFLLAQDKRGQAWQK